MHDFLILFDVDATLLITGGSGMRSMERAGLDLFGPRLRWDAIEPSGGLDPQLLSQAALQGNMLLEPEHHEAFRTRYVAILEGELKRNAHAVRAMPGIHEVLALLRARTDVVLGLLTGNYREAAFLKLQAVGVDPAWFSVAAFGDEARSRPELVALAMRRYEALFGAPPCRDRVLVIGDTPKDVDAALKNGCVAFGVATGKYGRDELEAAGAHVTVKDLSDPAPLVSRIADGK